MLSIKKKSPYPSPKFRSLLIALPAGGDRPRPVALPLQHRPLSGRQTHHVGPGRRPHHQHAHRLDGLRRGRRSLHDPPLRPGHHGHAHLPTLAQLQAHRRAGRGRVEGETDFLTVALDRTAMKGTT